MTTVRLTHGTVTGAPCPHCRLVCQRLCTPNPYGQPPTVRGGLAAHVELLHPEHWAAWLAWQGGPRR